MYGTQRKMDLNIQQFPPLLNFMGVQNNFWHIYCGFFGSFLLHWLSFVHWQYVGSCAENRSFSEFGQFFTNICYFMISYFRITNTYKDKVNGAIQRRLAQCAVWCSIKNTLDHQQRHAFNSWQFDLGLVSMVLLYYLYNFFFFNLPLYISFLSTFFDLAEVKEQHKALRNKEILT